MGLFVKHYPDGDSRNRLPEWLGFGLLAVLFVILPICALIWGPPTTVAGNAQITLLGFQLLFLLIGIGGVVLFFAGLFKKKPMWMLVGVIAAALGFIVFLVLLTLSH
jgi:hypothetical protein